MDRLLARTLTIEHHTLIQLRWKRILLSVLDATRSDMLNRSRGNRPAHRRQRRQGKPQPLAECILVIHIAITTIRDTLTA